MQIIFIQNFLRNFPYRTFLRHVFVFSARPVTDAGRVNNDYNADHRIANYNIQPILNQDDNLGIIEFYYRGAVGLLSDGSASYTNFLMVRFL